MVLIVCQECGGSWQEEKGSGSGKNCPFCGVLSTQHRDEASDFEEDAVKGDTAALKFERRFTEGAARKKAEDQEKIDRQRAAVAEGVEDPKTRLRRLRDFTSSELPLTRGAKMQFIFLQMLHLSGPILGIATRCLLHTGKSLWLQYLDLLCEYEASLPAGQKRQLPAKSGGAWRRPVPVPQMDATTLLALLWMALSNCLYPILFSDLTYFLRHGFLRKLGKHMEEILNPCQRFRSPWYRALPSFPPWPPEVAEAAEQLSSLGLRCTWPTVNQLLPCCGEKLLASAGWQGHQRLRCDLLSNASQMALALPHGMSLISKVTLSVMENLRRSPAPLRLSDARGSRPEVAAFLFTLAALVKMTRRVSRNERTPGGVRRRKRPPEVEVEHGEGRDEEQASRDEEAEAAPELRRGAGKTMDQAETEQVAQVLMGEPDVSTSWRRSQVQNMQRQLRTLSRYKDYAATAQRDKALGDNESISSHTETEAEDQMVAKEELALVKLEPGEDEERARPSARARAAGQASWVRWRRMHRVGRVFSQRRPMPIGRKYTPIGSGHRRRRRKDPGPSISFRRRILMARYFAERQSKKVRRSRRQDWEDRQMRERLQRTPLVLCCRHAAHCLAGEPVADQGSASPLKRHRMAFESLVRLLVTASRALADAAEQAEQCLRRRQHGMVHLPAVPGQPLPCSDDDDDAPRIRVVHNFTQLHGSTSQL